jgi:hypothetical protein
MSDDLPKIWQDPDITQETLPVEMPIEDEIQLPSIEEQKNIVNNSELSKENKDLVSGLVEINQIAEVLSQIKSTESLEQRKTVTQAICEGFINARMRNNLQAEQLKQALLNRLLSNVENLDLELTSRIYTDLQDTSSIDAQQALANINGTSGVIPGQGGTTFNLNLATGENSMVTANTLNANPQQVGQLKEVAAMNTSIKAWSNIPLPKRKD